MAISFVGSVSQAQPNGSDITLDLTTITGLAQNDLVIVAYTVGSSDDGDYDMVVNSPTDYTEVADLFADDVQDCNLGVFRKVQGATPDTSVVVEGFGNMNNSIAAIAMAFRGVDTTTPMDVAATTATGIDTANPNPPSINHNNPSGVWTVVVGAAGHSAGDRTYTFPTGYTTDAVSLSGNDSDDCTIGMGYRSSGVSDPEDPGVMTFSGTDNVNYCWAAVTMALRPATGATTFAPSVSGVGTTTVSSGAVRGVAGTVSGVGSTAVTEGTVRGVAASVAGAGTATASINTRYAVAATADGAASASAVVSLALATQADGTSTASVSISSVFALAATASGVAATEATVEHVSENGTAYELTANAAGVADTASPVSTVRAVAAPADGVGTTAVSLAAVREVAAAADGAASASASVTVPVVQTATADGQATVTLDMAVVRSLAAQADGSSDVAADVEGGTVETPTLNFRRMPYILRHQRKAEAWSLLELLTRARAKAHGRAVAYGRPAEPTTEAQAGVLATAVASSTIASPQTVAAGRAAWYVRGTGSATVAVAGSSRSAFGAQTRAGVTIESRAAALSLLRSRSAGMMSAHKDDEEDVLLLAALLLLRRAA
jgi:hypothetical protein